MTWSKLLCSKRLRDATNFPEETRTQIERDYGRVVFSTPMRRLQDKAQVFPLEPIDAVRTRLTHSLEVSAVARGYAKGVAKALLKSKSISIEDAYEIESLAATCGLIHDIGNPPFGHAGEDAIRGWFKNAIQEKSIFEPSFWEKSENKRYKNDLLNFEGNAQSLRIMTKLQVLSDKFGLNLTAATLAASLKYTANSKEIGNGGQSKKKLGYYATEDDEFSKVRSLCGITKGRHPVTLLVEAADDSVYAVVDIEDGIKKGVITWSQIKEILKDHIDETLYKETVIAAEVRISKGEFDQSGQTKDELISQYFRTLLIAKAHEAVIKTFIDNYTDIMSGEFDKELLFETGKVGNFYKILKKEIGQKYVWNSKETLRLELLGKKVIEDLLDTFSKAKPSEKSKKFGEKSFHLMSSNYRNIYWDARDNSNLPEPYLRAILITDYICGMTDTYALNLHKELHGG